MRHAHAGDPGRWDGDDSRRPLSDRGRRQAQALVERLRREGAGKVTAVLSSPALRCADTVTPTATELGLGVVTESALAEGTPPATVHALIGRLGGDVVLCSHGDVIGAFVLDLDAAGVLRDPPACSKASTWILDVVAGTVVSARYLGPPEL